VRKGQPAALDVRAIFTAAHEAIEHPPDDAARELWAQIVREAFVPDGWHDKPQPGEPWYWHASALCKCVREQILKRANLDTDGIRVESKNVFAIGHTYHALARYGMHILGQYEDVRTEVGGVHPRLPLAGRADLAYRFESEPVIVDWKTESEYAGKHRREEKVDGSSARHEHRVQMTADAMILEALDPTIPPYEHGWAVYIGKESGDIDQQHFEITGELRNEVERRVNDLDEAWGDYALLEVLPPVLPDEEKRGRDKKAYMAAPWQCRARSDTDGRGMYCQARTACFERRPK
jgi:hypothetical protein